MTGHQPDTDPVLRLLTEAELADDAALAELLDGLRATVPAEPPTPSRDVARLMSARRRPSATWFGRRGTRTTTLVLLVAALAGGASAAAAASPAFHTAVRDAFTTLGRLAGASVPPLPSPANGRPGEGGRGAGQPPTSGAPALLHGRAAPGGATGADGSTVPGDQSRHENASGQDGTDSGRGAVLPGEAEHSGSGDGPGDGSGAAGTGSPEGRHGPGSAGAQDGSSAGEAQKSPAPDPARDRSDPGPTATRAPVTSTTPPGEPGADN